MAEKSKGQEWFAYFNDLGNLSGLDCEKSLRKSPRPYEELRKEAMDKGYKINSLRELQILHARKRGENSESRREVKKELNLHV